MQCEDAVHPGSMSAHNPNNIERDTDIPDRGVKLGVSLDGRNLTEMHKEISTQGLNSRGGP